MVRPGSGTSPTRAACPPLTSSAPSCFVPLLHCSSWCSPIAHARPLVDPTRPLFLCLPLSASMRSTSHKQSPSEVAFRSIQDHYYYVTTLHLFCFFQARRVQLIKLSEERANREQVAEALNTLRCVAATKHHDQTRCFVFCISGKLPMKTQLLLINPWLELVFKVAQQVARVKRLFWFWFWLVRCC